MFTRIWRTEFDPGRLDELQWFADEVSAPMFRDLSGCLGVLFAVSGSTWITQTHWESEAHIADAEASPRYRAVVQDLLGRDILRGVPIAEVFAVTTIEGRPGP